MESFAPFWKQKKLQMHVVQEFLTVTPGIRLAEGEAHDQVRVATPVKCTNPWFFSYCCRSSNNKSGKPLQAYETILKMWEENA